MPLRCWLCLLSAELWRNQVVMKLWWNLYKLKNRENQIYLGPTHEETFTAIVYDSLGLTKLPLNLYQIQPCIVKNAHVMDYPYTEFIMKDAYSFHANYDGLDSVYDDIRLPMRIHSVFRLKGYHWWRWAIGDGQANLWPLHLLVTDPDRWVIWTSRLPHLMKFLQCRRNQAELLNGWFLVKIPLPQVDCSANLK